MLVIGALMFLPGSYHVWIAYHAWYKRPGFSFAQIPDFDG